MTTDRLTLMPLDALQMRALLTGDTPGGIRYDGEPLETVLSSVLRAQLAATEGDPARAPWYRLWLFIDTATHTAIGSACFKGGPDAAGSVEIGYGLGRHWRGRGYAREAVHALCYWALEQPEVRAVTAQTEPENHASIGLLKACGFAATGEADDLLQWTLKKHALFVCPVCRGMLARTPDGLACAQRHTVDRARQGYYNLLRKKPDTLYEDKALFTARRTAYAAGFFNPLVEAIRAWLPSAGVVLDAGCGEGSLLSALCTASLHGIGLDISREAVRMAAAADKAADWCVGDLCDIPLGNSAVDAVVNVLTPANYGEFARVLRTGGLLIKAVPNAGHLAEVRAASGLHEMTPSLPAATEALARQFAPAGNQRIRYTVPCDAPLAAAVFAMTPMTVHAQRCEMPAGDITVDVTLLAGEKR